jgi:hypothetical protein
MHEGTMLTDTTYPPLTRTSLDLLRALLAEPDDRDPMPTVGILADSLDDAGDCERAATLRKVGVNRHRTGYLVDAPGVAHPELWSLVEGRRELKNRVGYYLGADCRTCHMSGSIWEGDSDNICPSCNGLGWGIEPGKPNPIVPPVACGECGAKTTSVDGVCSSCVADSIPF